MFRVFGVTNSCLPAGRISSFLAILCVDNLWVLFFMNYKFFITNSAWQNAKSISSDVKRKLLSLQDPFLFKMKSAQNFLSLPIDNYRFFDFSVRNLVYRVIYTVLEDKKEIVVVSVYWLRKSFSS